MRQVTKSIPSIYEHYQGNWNHHIQQFFLFLPPSIDNKINFYGVTASSAARLGIIGLLLKYKTNILAPRLKPASTR